MSEHSNQETRAMRYVSWCVFFVRPDSSVLELSGNWASLELAEREVELLRSKEYFVLPPISQSDLLALLSPPAPARSTETEPFKIGGWYRSIHNGLTIRIKEEVEPLVWKVEYHPSKDIDPIWGISELENADFRPCDAPVAVPEPRFRAGQWYRDNRGYEYRLLDTLDAIEWRVVGRDAVLQWFSEQYMRENNWQPCAAPGSEGK